MLPTEHHQAIRPIPKISVRRSMVLARTRVATMTSNVHPLPGHAEGAAQPANDLVKNPGSGTAMCLNDILIGFSLPPYLLFCSDFTVYCLVDFWLAEFRLLGWPFPGVKFAAEQHLAMQTFAYATGGAVLGAIILCFRHLYKHASHGTFRACYVGFYLFGPWSAALLGITSYMLARGGLLVFAGGSQQAMPSETSVYAYFALGILTGFGHERMLAKVNALAKQIFGDRPRS
jgi:hypothetical protein